MDGLLIAAPFAAVGILFFLFGRHLSGRHLAGFLVIVPIVSFVVALSIFHGHDRPDIAIRIAVVTATSLIAVIGALIGFAVRKLQVEK